jgi:hypothetical protein
VVDQVYQPSDDDDQSETPSPQVELPLQSFGDKFEGETDPSDLTVEEGAAQRRRPVDPESPEDAHQRPITVHKGKGDGPLTLNEAADDLHFSRGWQHADELRAAGMTERQLREMAADAMARSQRMHPSAPPPPEVKVLDHFGEEGKPLSVTEAADALTSWRARHAEEQQEALQELAAEAAQERLAEAQQPQPEPQAEPQQPQPTPEVTERQQLAQERQRIAALKRVEGHEAALRMDYDQLVAAVVQQFPSLQHGPPTPEQVENLRQTDPARFQKLAMADQMLRERQQRIAALAQHRGQQEQQQEQASRQQRAAARAIQDKAFEMLAAQHIPNWQTSHTEIRSQARKTLENAGLSDGQIQRLWNGDDSIDAHSSVLQLVLAKAAQWDLAQQRLHQVRQAPVPPVIRPGTYRASDDGVSARDLERQLKNAKGREALRIATELTRARRNGG